MKRLFLCLAFGAALSNCVIKPDDNTGTLYPSPLVLTDLKVTLAHASLFVGQTTNAVASGADQFANPIATGAVTYSSNSASATITQDGIVSAIAPGTVTISATTATKHAETLLTIAATAALASLNITLPNSSVRVGQTATATIAGKDQYGLNFATTDVSWSSSSPNVAMITQSGAVTGVSIGQTTLSASSQGVTTALPISVVSATPTVHSVTLAGERHIKVGDPYVYSPTITMSDGNTATLPVTYTLNPTDAGNISASGILTALKTGIISVVATVNNVQFPTTVTSYDWSSGPGATTYSATLFADSAFTTTGPLLSPIPGLTIDCSQLDQPQSAFNIFATLSSVLAPGTTIQYSIDGGPVHTDDWLLASAAANRFAFPAPTAADRVAFAKALASGHTLKVTWTQSLQGPITGKFRLTGMATAIAPVLAACGFN